jgi:hypothetical protein
MLRALRKAAMRAPIETKKSRSAVLIVMAVVESWNWKAIKINLVSVSEPQ